MSVILDEFYIPNEDGVVEALKSSPVAREIYQLSLQNFFEDIRNIIDQLEPRIALINREFEKVKLLIKTKDSTLASASEVFYDQMTKMIDELNPILDQIENISTTNFAGYNLDEETSQKLFAYLEVFRQRMTVMVKHRLRTPISILSTTAYLIYRGSNIASVNFEVIQGKSELIDLNIQELLDIFAELEEFIAVCYSLDRREEIVDDVSLEEIPDLLLDVSNDELLRDFDFRLEEIPLGDQKIRIDRDQFKRAIKQIFYNCVDFKKRDVTLVVKINIVIENISENKYRVVIYITDNGSGIGQRELPKVFEPFYNKDMVGEQFLELPGTGTGLGLTIARGLIERYGNINIQSTEGEGATVVIDFKAR